MLSRGVFLRALGTKPLLGHLANSLLNPLGCIKGHLTHFKLSNLSTFYDRAQQFSSWKTIAISGHKVKINIRKWVGLSFISICCKRNHRRQPDNLYEDMQSLVIPRVRKLQSWEKEKIK